MTLRRSFLLRLMRSLAVASGLVATGAFRTPVTAQARERTLYVSAVDGDGHPVDGLGPGDFVVREDGVRRDVVRVSETNEPTDVVLLVDDSASAAGAIPSIRETLARFIEDMGSGNAFTLVGLADRPTIIVRFTGDPREVTRAIGGLIPTPGSGMTFLDAVTEMSLELDRRETRRPVMVAILTEGPEFTKRYSRDVTARLIKGGVPLHAITIGRFEHSIDHGERERLFLLYDGTRVSGGQWVELSTPRGLADALEQLAAELRSQYAVVYTRPEMLVPAERVQISSVRNGVTVRGAQARSETGR